MGAAVRSPLSADIRCAGVPPSGEWATVTTSEFELSCCMAVRDAIYVGTDDARMLRMSHEGGVLDPVDGFDNIAVRDA